MNLFGIIILAIIGGTILPSLNNKRNIFYWFILIPVNIVAILLIISFLTEVEGWTLMELIALTLFIGFGNASISTMTTWNVGVGVYCWLVLLIASLVIWQLDWHLVVSLV